MKERTELLKGIAVVVAEVERDLKREMREAIDKAERDLRRRIEALERESTK
ncbi:hypothetical protein GOC32_22795 [Sinorhizobium meliloti]|nr:hypothetical protein [Sinorhizobium meliloti]